LGIRTNRAYIISQRRLASRIWSQKPGRPEVRDLLFQAQKEPWTVNLTEVLADHWADEYLVVSMLKDYVVCDCNREGFYSIFLNRTTKLTWK